MPRRKKHIDPILKDYELPSRDNELKTHIDTKKIDMMEQAVSSIEYAVDNHLSMIEIFQFRNSEFVVMVSEKDYLTNIDYIYDYYIQNEKYELCDRVYNLRKKLGSTIKLNET